MEGKDDNVKPSYQELLAGVDDRIAEEQPNIMSNAAEILGGDPAPAAPVEDAPVEEPAPAAPAAPAEPAPEPVEAKTDEPAADYGSVYEEFGGDPAKMAAALAAERSKKPEAPAAPASAAAPAKPAEAATPEPEATPAEPLPPLEFLDAVARKPQNARTQDEHAMVRELSALGQARGQLETRFKAIVGQRTGLQTLEAELGRAQVLADHFKAAKTADPDDFRSAEALEKQEATIAKLEHDIALRTLQLNNTQTAFDKDIAAWDGRRDNLLGYVNGVQETTGRAHAQEKQRTEAAAENTRVWNATLPQVLKDLKLDVDDAQRKEVNDFLVERAMAQLVIRQSNGQGDFPDIAAWMKEQAPLVVRLVQSGARTAVKTYVDQKKRDANPRAPQGAAASGTPAPAGGSKKKMSYEEALRASDEQSKREFGARA